MNEVTPLRVSVVVITVVIGITLGLGVKSLVYGFPQATNAPSDASKAKASTSPSPKPPTDLYSLAIPVQQERKYPGSTITTEAPLLDRGGWRSGTGSYRSDGLKIYTQVAAPVAKPPKEGYPTIILVHGYIQPSAYTTDEQFYTDFAAGLAQRGYLVIKPDLRGHGRSWGVPEGAYFSSGYTADVLNLATSLKSFPMANIDKLAIVGHSLGGRVALNSVVVEPTAFKAGIIVAGAVGRIPDMYYNWTSYSDFGDPITLGIRKRVVELFGAPNDGDDFWQKSEPYNFLSGIKTPLFLTHSTMDDAVPYRFSDNLNAALLAAGKDVKLSTYDGDHSFSGDYRTRLLDEMTAYFADRLE